jgi:hypothetical protein
VRSEGRGRDILSGGVQEVVSSSSFFAYTSVATIYKLPLHLPECSSVAAALPERRGKVGVDFERQGKCVRKEQVETAAVKRLVGGRDSSVEFGRMQETFASNWWRGCICVTITFVQLNSVAGDRLGTHVGFPLGRPFSGLSGTPLLFRSCA